MDSFAIGGTADDGKLTKAQDICGPDIQSGLLAEALRAAGSPFAAPEGNKRLASIGNRVLALHITEKAISDGLSLGDGSSQLQRYASNSHLANICRASGLVSCVHVPIGQFGPIGDKTAAATVEAVIAAAYKSEGMTAAARVIENLKITAISNTES